MSSVGAPAACVDVHALRDVVAGQRAVGADVVGRRRCSAIALNTGLPIFIAIGCVARLHAVGAGVARAALDCVSCDRHVSGRSA